MTFLLLSTMLMGPAWAQDDTTDEAAEEPTEDAPAEPAEDGEPTEADLERAVELYTNGKTLFEEANYEDAIVAWQASYDLSKKPNLLFNLASAHERLAQYGKAMEALNQYRAYATADERAAIERRMTNLERLEKERKAKEAEAAANAVSNATEPEVPEKPAGRTQRLVGYGLIGLGAVSLAAGAGMGLASGGAATSAADNCIDVDGGGLCLDSAKSDLSSNKTLAALADVSFIVGAVAAGAGIVTIATSPSTRLGVGPQSITFAGKF